LAEWLVAVRGRVVVVVGGVMPIQGDGNSVHKAKDHSRGAPNQECSPTALETFAGWRELARDGEPDALKDARPVREGLRRDRLLVRTSMAR